MNRRDVIKQSIVLGLSGIWGLAHAAPADDKGAYRKAKRVVPRANPAKIDVVEFFWYGCSPCYHFEPALTKWRKTVPQDVNFMQVPVGWPNSRANFAGHQRLFYTLDAMGVLQTAHMKVFDAIHKDKKELANDAQIFDFAVSIGLKREEFANTFKSFSVNAKCTQAKALSEAYGVDSVPTLGVDGQFFTSASLAGTEEDALRTVDLLIKRQRQA